MPDVTPAAAARDNRWKLVEATMRRLGYRSDSLIEALHTAQEAYGYLEPDVLRQLGRTLRVPPSQVYGVATFYNYFSLKPQGRHTCIVCTGTACYIEGAPALLDAVDEVAHVGAGETTPGGEVSVLTARCIGSCGLAPAAVMDGAVVGTVDPAEVRRRVEEWMRHDS